MENLFVDEKSVIGLLQVLQKGYIVFIKNNMQGFKSIEMNMNHGGLLLPESEAQWIQSLFERIKAMVQQLSQSTGETNIQMVYDYFQHTFPRNIFSTSQMRELQLLLFSMK